MLQGSGLFAECLSEIIAGPAWHDDGVLKLYLYCLSKASHNEFKWRGLELQPGDIPLSERHVATALDWSRSKLDRKLELLSKSGLVSITSIPQTGTLVRVLNWHCFETIAENTGTVTAPVENQNQTSTLPINSPVCPQNETSAPGNHSISSTDWSQTQSSDPQTGFIMRPNPYMKKISPSSVSSSEPDGFLKIWLAYPRKRRNDREKAASQVAKALNEGATIQAILDALNAELTSDTWIKEDGRFVPGITKWLDKELWHDYMKRDVPKEDDEKWESR